MINKPLSIAFVFAALLLAGCEEEKKVPGAASKMTAFLRKNGFDVVISRNDRLQNYDETIVVLRDSVPWEGAEALARTLKTKNVMTIRDDRRNFLVASIYIGKDFKKIVEPEQGEEE